MISRQCWSNDSPTVIAVRMFTKAVSATYLIGAAAQIADYNGVEKVSHIKEKLVEMTHLNETIYATGIASSF